jgi:hypothetical protein
VFSIVLSMLRERGDDVVLIAEDFLAELNKGCEGPPKAFTRTALARLKAHSWPGNVRELRNVVQRAFILAPNDVDVDSLPLGGAAEERSGTSLVVRVGTPIDEAEKRLILATARALRRGQEAGGGVPRHQPQDALQPAQRLPRLLIHTRPAAVCMVLPASGPIQGGSENLQSTERTPATPAARRRRRSD